MYQTADTLKADTLKIPLLTFGALIVIKRIKIRLQEFRIVQMSPFIRGFSVHWQNHTGLRLRTCRYEQKNYLFHDERGYSI